MALEARLMAVEVIYLWRALPFCSEDSKSQLLDMLSAAMPPDAQPIHMAMTAWLRGGVLNSLGRTADAEQVYTWGVRVLYTCEISVSIIL